MRSRGRTRSFDMQPVTQSRTGDRGTCFRACIASILNLPERAVVDFDGPRKYYHDEQGLDDYWANVEGWLAEHGLRYRRVPVGGARPVGWSTIEGVSPRGGLHACVAYDGELVHDPHPRDGTGRGLVEPRYYGLLEPIRPPGSAKDARIPKPLRKVLKASGRVRLLELTQPNTGVVVYAVEYPHKVGGVDINKTVMAQFLRLSEAEDMYRRMVNHYAKAEDRADMLALRRNTEKQGGPFFIQETTENGRERTIPARSLSRAADASPARVALLLAALLAWYRARKAECGEKEYDLTRYVPKRRTFDAPSSGQLNRYPMSRLLDALGIDIKEYMRRDEAQKERLLRIAIEKLDAARADARRRTP